MSAFLRCWTQLAACLCHTVCLRGVIVENADEARATLG